MKKAAIIVALLSLSSIYAGAQSRTSFGLKLDANLTNVKVSDLQGAQTGFRPGASLSGYVRIGMTDVVSLQTGLTFNYTEARIRVGAERSRFKYAGVELPLYVNAQFNAGTGKILIGVGPHIGYGLSADSKTENLPDCSPLSNVIELDHWYAGGGLTAGYEFRNKISVNAGYKLGYDLSSRHKTGRVNTQTISLGIGYRF